MTVNFKIAGLSVFSKDNRSIARYQIIEKRIRRSSKISESRNIRESGASSSRFSTKSVFHLSNSIIILLSNRHLLELKVLSIFFTFSSRNSNKDNVFDFLIG